MGHECRRTRRHAYVLPARRGARLRCVCGIVGPSVERHGVCWRWCRWMCAPWLACIDEGDSTMVLSASLSVIYRASTHRTCPQIYARINSDVYAHVYAHVDVCMDVCIDVCIDMCMYMCIGIGTCAGMCIRHVCRHAYRYMYTHVHGRVLNNAAKDCA